MDTLRIILIVLGILLVAGIYLFDVWRQRKAREAQRPIEPEPPLADELGNFQVDENDIPPEAWLGMTFSAHRQERLDDDHLHGLKGIGDDPESVPVEQPVQQSEAQLEPEAEATEQTEPASVIVLTLIAQKGKPIRGPLLLRALKDAGLSFGDMGIFHYVEGAGEEPLFSVANILEPGRFVLSEMAEFNTPGIALFMSLPTSLPGGEALRIMLSKAREIGAQVNATLCDGQRQPLSDEMLAWLEKMAQQSG